MPGLRMNFGLALFKAGELKEAIHTFDGLLKGQTPSSPEAQRLTILLGLAHYGLEEFAAAVPYLKEATASDPQNLPFRLVLAHSCLGSKQYQCVLDVYHEILLLNAESAEADMLAGEALDEMKDHAGATQQFRAAVKANPKEPNVHFGLGYLLWAQCQYEEAAQEFQAELANVPNHVQALTYLADANMKMSRPEIALPLLRKAIALDPGMELAHLNLGILHADAGRRDEALRELKIAAKLSPNDVNVHWRLARLYQAMGRKDEANAEFHKTKSLTKAADDSVFTKLENARAKKRKTPHSFPPLNNKKKPNPLSGFGFKGSVFFLVGGVVWKKGLAGPDPLGSPGPSGRAPEGIRRRQTERQQCCGTKIEAAGGNVALCERRLMPAKADSQPAVFIKGPRCFNHLADYSRHGATDLCRLHLFRQFMH